MNEHHSEYYNKGSTTRRNFLTVENGGEEKNFSLGPSSPKTHLDIRKLNFYDRNSISEGNLGQHKQNTSRRGVDENENGSNSQIQYTERRRDQQNEEENDSSSQDYSDENQQNGGGQSGSKSNVDRRNGMMVDRKKSKFNDLIFQLRMKNKVRRLANSINSRMYKNLTLQQFKMIGDKASDRSYISKYSQQQDQQTPNSGGDHENSDRRKSIIFQFMKQIDTFLPVFDPRSKLKVYLEILNLISVILIFYSFCIIISFKMKMDTLIPSTALEIALGFIFVNSFVNLNTGFYEDMKLSKDRQEMFAIYYKTHFFVDIFSFVSIMTLFIFDKTSFLDDDDVQPQHQDDVEVSDVGTLFRFIAFIPFIFKLRDFSKFMIDLEEKVIFQKQEQNVIQLVKLFSSIILIDHFMACLWVFSSKLSFNIDSSWQTKKNYQYESWFRQYTLSFYYSTVTMTTVGYGDIVPTNQTETIVSIFMMLFSSGVFGFTLNQIGIIFTELYADLKETRRKMKIINIHMEKRNVKHPLRMQIRSYLDYVWRENNEQFQNESAAIIDQLNDSLKKELQLHQNEKIIMYLKNHYSEAFIQKAFTMIQEVQCKPQQLIYKAGQMDSMCLYLIEKGKVEVFYKTKAIRNTQSQQYFIHEIGEGQLFGISQFYTGLPRDLNVRAVGFVSLLKISREDFMKQLEQFPEDKEAFCYIRDSLTLYQDGWKSSSACPSCGSCKHHLLDCNYIHYVPHQQNTCLRHNYIPPNSQQIERRKLMKKPIKKLIGDEHVFEESEEGDDLRIRQRMQTRYDLPQLLEQLYFDQLEFIEDYECKYLKYNFDFKFMASQKDQEQEEEEKQKEEQNEENNININKIPDDGSLNQFNQQYQGQVTTSLDQSALVQFDQISEYDKQNSIQLERRDSNSDFSPLQKKGSILSPKRMPIRDRDQNQEVKMVNQQKGIMFRGPRKSTNQSHPINSPSARNSYKPKSIIFSEAFEKQYTPSDFSKFSNEQKQQQQQQQQEGGNAHSSGNNLNIHLQQVTNTSNTTNISPFNSGNNNNVTFTPNSTYKPNLFKQQDEQPVLPQLQLQKIVSADHANSFLHQPFTTHTTVINSSNNINQQQSIVRNSDRQTTNLKRAFSIKMRKFQNSIIKNIEQIMQKTNEKDEIKQIKDLDENNEQYGLSQIFRSFDKQKNYYVYFPFNNLNYLLMKLETKSQIGRKVYLDILQQKKKQPLHQQSSSHTLFRSKYEKLKIKTDRLGNKGSRGNSSMYGSHKQKTQEFEHVNEIANGSYNRKSAFFERNPVESPIGSLTDKQLNILSAKSINNPKISFNNFLSRNELFSQQEINYDSNPKMFSQGGDLSPNIQDQDFSTPDFHDIHRFEFKAKKNYFNPNN